MDKINIPTEEVNRVKDYMNLFYCGKARRTPRRQIADALGIEDRRFREICSEIPEIITSSKFGYYILPLTDPTGEETTFARNIVEGEERRRMIALYLRQRRQRVAIKKMQAAERQMEFNLV